MHLLNHMAKSNVAMSARGVVSARPGLVWFKPTDLRISDHEPLLTAHAGHSTVIHLFVFDPASFGTSRVAGVPRMGQHRGRFLLEAVADLRTRLRARGSELILRTGPVAATLAAVVRATRAEAVYSHGFEPCSEEQATDKKAAAALSVLPGGAVPLRVFWGGATLYHPADLPFDATSARGLPQVFTQFRRAVEGSARPRDPLPEPAPFRPPPLASSWADALGDPSPFPLSRVAARGANEGVGRLPSLAELGADDPTLLLRAVGIAAGAVPDGSALESDSRSPPLLGVAPAASDGTARPSGRRPDAAGGHNLHPDPRADMPFLGGETNALSRLRSWIWDRDCLRTYKDSRNGLLGADYSSKLSPWLATGCVTARQIAAEVRACQCCLSSTHTSIIKPIPCL